MLMGSVVRVTGAERVVAWPATGSWASPSEAVAPSAPESARVASARSHRR